jgi:hypothetical protein
MRCVIRKSCLLWTLVVIISRAYLGARYQMHNLISLNDAARRLSVSRCTIARHLSTVRIGARVLVNLVDVEALTKPKNPPASEATK